MFIRLKLMGLSLAGLLLVGNQAMLGGDLLANSGQGGVANSRFSELTGGITQSIKTANGPLAKQISVVTEIAVVPNLDNPEQSIQTGDKSFVDAVINNAQLVGASVYPISPEDREIIRENLFSFEQGTALMGEGALSIFKGLGHLCFGTAKLGLGSIIVISIVGKFVVVKSYEASAWTCINIYKFYRDREEKIRADGSFAASSNN